MKRYLVMPLIALLIVVFASTAFAEQTSVAEQFSIITEQKISIPEGPIIDHSKLRPIASPTTTEKTDGFQPILPSTVPKVESSRVEIDANTFKKVHIISSSGGRFSINYEKSKVASIQSLGRAYSTDGIHVNYWVEDECLYIYMSVDESVPARMATYVNLPSGTSYEYMCYTALDGGIIVGALSGLKIKTSIDVLVSSGGDVDLDTKSSYGICAVVDNGIFIYTGKFGFCSITNQDGIINAPQAFKTKNAYLRGSPDSVWE